MLSRISTLVKMHAAASAVADIGEGLVGGGGRRERAPILFPTLLPFSSTEPLEGLSTRNRSLGTQDLKS